MGILLSSFIGIHYEGFNSKEIALIEGMSHNTVRQRLMTIRSYIKKILGEDYEY
jgi:DNA-directed RNA polymerase specialized sigma24 family protein